MINSITLKYVMIMKKQEFLCFYTYSSLLPLEDDILIAWFPLKVLFKYTASNFFMLNIQLVC